jgi:glycosyltransferase involved in cell wall biosynthesis
MTNQLVALLHAPTKVVLEFAYVLQVVLGYEVMLFVCPNDADEKVRGLWYHAVGDISIYEFLNSPLRLSYKDTVISGYQINYTQSCAKEYSMMLSLIHAWNPEFVFAVGAGNPVTDLTSKFTTLVSMPLTSTCPVSEAQIFIRAGKAKGEYEEEYQEVVKNNGQRQLFVKETIPVTVARGSSQTDRAQLGLPDDRFIIAVVGNRLDNEINDEFVGVMQEIIEKNPETAFAIIGKVELVKEHFKQKVFENHIFYLGYQKELINTYEVLDLYLNPKRWGGGFSSVMALMAGIPVVTLPDCDVSVAVGKDFVVPDYGKMIETVCRYVRDKEFYLQQKQRAKEIAANNTDDKMVDYVRELLQGIEALL